LTSTREHYREQRQSSLQALGDYWAIVATISDIFQRPKGDGWLVLADRIPTIEGEFSNLANSLLTHANLAFPPVCVLADPIPDPSLPRFLKDLEVLLDVENVVVTLEDTMDWDLLNPGMLILTGGRSEQWVTALGDTHFGVLILQALTDGLLLFTSDAAAAGLGSWVLNGVDESPFPGLNWLHGSVILPWTETPAENEAVRAILSRTEPLYAMGIAGGRMIALGPEGEVELWGIDAPTILIGSGWRN
jgi:hypothetical protein